VIGFCDWLTMWVRVEKRPEIRDGEIVFLNRNGEFQYAVDKRLMLEGSHDTRVAVRSEVGDQISISGNPAKWFQGHNLWGPTDYYGLAVAFSLDVICHLGISFTTDDLLRLYETGGELKRIDVTAMYKFPEDAVPGWLETVSALSKGGQQAIKGTGEYNGRTVYVGQKSRRVAMKLYDKAAELKRHPLYYGLRSDLGRYEQMLDYAKDTLRVEVTLRSMELKDRSLNNPIQWSRPSGAGLIAERLEKMSILDNAALADHERQDLPRRLQAAYALWLDGMDLRTIYSRRQFYRHRADLKEYGIDISRPRPRIVQPERQYALGRPLRSFLTEPMSVPEWAEGTELTYEPPAVPKVG
jgi:II/X family phage/plasmid replication protein